MRFKHSIAVLIGLLSVAGLSCEDTTRPPAPEPPPQISVTRSWGVSRTALQSVDVHSVLVTSAGELWIGGESGISVYPSVTATTRSAAWDQNNGVSNPKIRGMVENNGKIYVATWGGGLSEFDMTLGTWKTRDKRHSGIINNQIADIEVANDILYLATNEGLSIYDINANTWTKFDRANGLLMPSVTNCEGCPVDELLSAVAVANTSRGVERWHGRRIEFGAPERAEPYLGITVRRRIVVVPPDSVVMKNVYYTIRNSDLPEAGINDIFYDDVSGLFYLALATKGLAEVDVDNSRWRIYTMEDGLPSNVVNSITKAGGRLWVGTQTGIAGQRGNGSWQAYRKGAGLPGHIVRNVYSDDGTRLWVSFVDAGVALVDVSSGKGL